MPIFSGELAVSFREGIGTPGKDRWVQLPWMSWFFPIHRTWEWLEPSILSLLGVMVLPFPETKRKRPLKLRPKLGPFSGAQGG